MRHNRRKKSNRLRGSTTHGYGSMKKHRGAGHRGGRGNAGSGKRADSKKPSIWKDKDYFGKHGFKISNTKKIKAINIADIEERFNKLVQDKIIEMKENLYEVNLKKMGYDKLLSTGSISHKYRIIAKLSSKEAIEKIKAAGGEVILNESSA